MVERGEGEGVQGVSAWAARHAPLPRSKASHAEQTAEVRAARVGKRAARRTGAVPRLDERGRPGIQCPHIHDYRAKLRRPRSEWRRRGSRPSGRLGATGIRWPASAGAEEQRCPLSLAPLVSDAKHGPSEARAPERAHSEHLHPAAVVISHEDLALPVHRHAKRTRQLTRARSVRAKAPGHGPVGPEHLHSMV